MILLSRETRGAGCEGTRPVWLNRRLYDNALPIQVHEVRGRARFRMTGLDLRRLVHVERDDEIGQRRRRECKWIRNIFGTAEMVTPGPPEKVSDRSVEQSIRGEAAEAGRAMCTDVKSRGGAVPNALEIAHGEPLRRSEGAPLGGGSARIARRQRVARLRNLLGRRPRSHPVWLAPSE